MAALGAVTAAHVSDRSQRASVRLHLREIGQSLDAVFQCRQTLDAISRQVELRREWPIFPIVRESDIKLCQIIQSCIY